jgi:hypothetical protein
MLSGTEVRHESFKAVSETKLAFKVPVVVISPPVKPTPVETFVTVPVFDVYVSGLVASYGVYPNALIILVLFKEVNTFSPPEYRKPSVPI